MFKNVAVDTNIIFFLMIAVGTIGVLGKLMNHLTLCRMVRASGSMSKSSHKLMKLVRAKYEHACMIHDTVDNVGVFVEKYIYEYRGIIFRVHTWRQLQIQSIWFTGVLAAVGAVGTFAASGLGELMYRYIAIGAAEMIVLFVVSQLSDESYKIKAIKNYMVDYLENVCAHRYRKTKQMEKTEKENIDVIAPEGTAARTAQQKDTPELSISIEGEPRRVEKGEATKAGMRRNTKEKSEADEQPALKEETIRQILEEFLA